MTSAKMRQLKVGFRGFWLNISKKVQLIFTKLKSFLGNHLLEIFEIKILKAGDSLLPWQRIHMRECWAGLKIMI